MNNEIYCKITGANYYRLSKEEKKKINKKQLNLNILRQKIFYPILIFINIILLLGDIKNFKTLWFSILGYRYLFYLHIIIVVGLLFFTIILYSDKIINKSYLFKKLISKASILFILIWCSFLAINAQLIHGQISAYIVGALSIAEV